jgi:O-Antigen ligase
MVLQKIGWVGGFVSRGIAADVSERVVGLTGGPWEVGAVLNFCYSLLIFDRNRQSSARFAVGLFVPTFALLLLTGARMPTLAHLALLFLFFFRRSRSTFRFLATSSVVASIALAGFLLIPNPVVERSSDLISTNNLEAFGQIYKNVDLSQGMKFTEIPYSEESDLSWLMRATKWSLALHFWTARPLSWIIGLGPGSLGPSLDGGWLRYSPKPE